MQFSRAVSLRHLLAAVSSGTRLLISWFGHVKNEFTQPAGWKLLGAAVASIIGILTIAAAFMSYESTNLDHELEAAERSYFQLMTDAGSESVRVRIGAIERIPLLLRKQTPVSGEVGPIEAFRLAFGGKERQTPAYLPEMQRLVKDLFSEVRANDSKEPHRELAALIDLMIDIGPEGWYEGKPRPARRRENALKWIWKTPAAFTRYTSFGSNTLDLFRNQPLSGIWLANFVLKNSDFSHSKVDGVNFTNCDLRDAILHGVSGSGSTFEFSHLEQADIGEAELANSDFESTVMSGATLAKGSFLHCRFENALLNDIKALAVRLSNSGMSGVHLDHAEMQNAMLDNCDLSQASLEQSHLEFADLTRTSARRAILLSTSLRNAVLRQADFSYADLRHADLTGANLDGVNLEYADLHGVVGITATSHCSGLRLKGAVGLTAKQIQTLLRHGAKIN